MKKILLISCFLVCGLLSSQIVKAQTYFYGVYFCEGNNGTQDNWNVFNSQSQNIPYYGQVYRNDEARSLKIIGSACIGHTIYIYDSSSNDTNKDWCEIFVKGVPDPSSPYIVPSFETSYENSYVKVTFHRGPTDNGKLDGKVSGWKIL